MDVQQSAPSAFIVRGEVEPEVIADSLRALLPSRHRAISRHRFTVLDTVDGRVRQSGTRLTQCGDERSASIAWQRGSGGQLVVRVQQPVNFVWDLPSGPLQRALTPTIGVRRLLAQADAEEYGSLLDVLDDQRKIVARLRIASGRARLPRSGNPWQRLPTVITLTALRGYEDVYQQLVPVIESRPGVESCPDGFDGVLLGVLGVPDTRNLARPVLDLPPTVRADVGARCIHQALLAILVANETGVRANLDTEFLHDFRVAVRRTRSLLRQIRHVFPYDAVDRFSTEFSWLGRLTGSARDGDVLVLSLRDKILADPDPDMEELLARLVEIQRLEHQSLVAALDGDRYRRLLSEWAAFLDESTPVACEPRNAGRPLAVVIAERAWRLCRRIARAAEEVDGYTPPERLHRLRVTAKKLRYLIDVAPPSHAVDDLDRVVRALKDVQRALGVLNDSSVQQQRLLECGHALRAQSGCERAVLAIERLSDERTQDRERLLAQAVMALARFRSRGTRSACRGAFRQRDWKGQQP